MSKTMDNAGGVMKRREAEGLETQGGEKPMKVYRKVKRSNRKKT